MADWVTISSLATAGGTLVLAVATFSSFGRYWNIDGIDPRERPAAAPELSP